MATTDRKTVPFENLGNPISDYCGGTGTMANFFKMLSKCKQDIIEQTGTDYSDETVLSLTDFISCVQSGVLCSRSVSVKTDACLYFKRRFNCGACCSNQPANSLTTA